MTKQEFLSGKVFRFEKNTGSNTFQYVSPFEDFGEGCIQRNILSSDGGRIILTDHEVNITKIGTKTFTVYTYVLDKKVQLKYRFEDLVMFINEK
jgi:hypothetical protein